MEVTYGPEWTYDENLKPHVTVPTPAVGWSASIGGRAEAGWNIGEALQAIVYGTADFILTKKGEPIGGYTHPVDELDFAGKMGVRVKALDFRIGELTIVESKFPLVLWKAEESASASPRPLFVPWAAPPPV
jgi:hypothetical protein